MLEFWVRDLTISSNFFLVVRGGLQVLGGQRPRLQSSLVAAPKPVDIPSVRTQNLGLDPNVPLVPVGGGGWATPKESGESGAKSRAESNAGKTSEPTGYRTAADILKSNLKSSEKEDDKGKALCPF